MYGLLIIRFSRSLLICTFNWAWLQWEMYKYLFITSIPDTFLLLLLLLLLPQLSVCSYEFHLFHLNRCARPKSCRGLKRIADGGNTNNEKKRKKNDYETKSPLMGNSFLFILFLFTHKVSMYGKGNVYLSLFCWLDFFFALFISTSTLIIYIQHIRIRCSILILFCHTCFRFIRP